MKYLALIYGEQGRWDALSDEERSRIYGEYMRFSEEGAAAGVVIGGAELTGPTSATTVRIRDGQTQVIDGPYAETKEVLGGYYLLECDSMDKALEWAAKIPGAQHGAIEVRPVHEGEDNSAARAANREGVAS